MNDRRIQSAFFMAVTVGCLVAIPGGRAFGFCPAGYFVCPGTVLTSCTAPVGTVVTCPPAFVGCAVTIVAHKTLHMNNMVINGVGTGAGATGICLTGNSSAVFGTGVVENFTTGVSMSAPKEVVTQVTAFGNTVGLDALGTAIGPNNTFKLNVVYNNTTTGIATEVGSAGIVIGDNEVFANGGTGIALNGLASVFSNLVVSNANDGIFANAAVVLGKIKTNTIDSNNIGNPGGAGIELAAGAVGWHVKNNLGIANGHLNFLDNNAGCVGNFWGPANNISLLPAGSWTPACAH